MSWHPVRYGLVLYVLTHDHVHVPARTNRRVLSICSVFFFSSRRRHTRCLSDWSSDVCSSDLLAFVGCSDPCWEKNFLNNGFDDHVAGNRFAEPEQKFASQRGVVVGAFVLILDEIGRASCRERV